ncbi:MAG: PAS domain S-box protein [Candidatus Moranbacteria bacterium]|nr:PAS domain S-box protein [Candidatus Moranbacteria bacterium]
MSKYCLSIFTTERQINLYRRGAIMEKTVKSVDQSAVCNAFWEQTPDSMWATDLTGILLRVSMKKAENHGFVDPEEMIGKMFDDERFMKPDEAEQVRKYMTEMLITGEKIADKIQRLERDGRIIYYSVSMFPIFGENKEIVGFAGTSRDITERINIEENLKNFYTTATHGIKNPLVFGNGILRRVINGKFGHISDNVKATLQNLLHGYDRGEKECVETIVRMVALGLGEKTFAAKNCHVDVGLEILLRVLNKHEKELDEKNITIDNRMHSIPPGAVKLQTDSNMLFSIFDNLIDNAIKYCSIGGVISIGYCISKATNEIIFNVYDDGDPPSEEFVNERMGKKFQRDNITEDGTGIGIYSVKESVRMLGGRFWYEETESGHPNFLFAFPLSDLII